MISLTVDLLKAGTRMMAVNERNQPQAVVDLKNNRENQRGL
jgi:hypothetical protein